jgi:predicted metal-binding protein
MYYRELEKIAAENGLKIFRTDFSKMVFEERVKYLCLNCNNYGLNWRCPGKIPQLDWQKIFQEYNNIVLLMYKSQVLNNENLFQIERVKSTNLVHKTLLKMEEYLWNSGMFMRSSFIGGSCKLCKNGCASDKCRNPLQARIPLEGTGCNVMETVKNIIPSYSDDIKFSQKHIFRFGLLVW